MSADRIERISLSVPSDLRYGESTRAMLDALTQRLEEETGTENLGHHVISAFSEAFNNVVWHAYGGSRTETIQVNVEVAATGITVEMIDEGAGFDIDSVEDPDLPAMPEGGLGLWIIKSLMSHMSYDRGERNVITMTKEFAKPLTFKDDTQDEV